MYKMRTFLRGKNFKYFCMAKISNIFGVLDIPDIFWRQTEGAGPNPTHEEKVRVPPPLTHIPWVKVYDEKLLTR